MDFVSDALFDGRRFRALTLVDNFSRECLSIRADQRIQGEDVANLLDQVVAEIGTPDRIRVDNGPEFIAKAIRRHSEAAGLEMMYGPSHKKCRIGVARNYD